MLKTLFARHPDVLPLLRHPLSTGTLQIIGDIRAYDRRTAQHSLRVGVVLALFGKTLRMPHQQLKDFLVGGLLHDAGKIHVPVQIIAKPGKLTHEERSLARLHPLHGQRVVAQTPGLPTVVANIITAHHERMDGGGYPHGWSGEQIPLEARMAAVVDVFCALTEKRPYKAPWSVLDAIQHLHHMADDGHLDPTLVGLFEDNLCPCLRRVEQRRLA